MILTFAASFLCCSAKSGGEASHNVPVKASGSFADRIRFSLNRPAHCSQSFAPRSRWFANAARRGNSPRKSCKCFPCRTDAPQTSRFAVTTFKPPMAALLPGARVSLAVIGSPASFDSFTASGESFWRGSPSARASPARQSACNTACRTPPSVRGNVRPDPCRCGGDFRRKQVHDRAVLVRRPDRAVAPQETGPGALLAAKAERAVEQSGREPFETDRHFAQPAAQLVHHAIDHAAADQRLADRRAGRPLRTMCEQITDGHREIMVRDSSTPPTV